MLDSDNGGVLIDLLESFLGDHRVHHAGHHQITFDCPNCSQMKGVENDGKGNLEINYEKGLFNCWACAETHDTKGWIYKLFKEYAPKDTLVKFIRGGFVFGERGTNEFIENNIINLYLPKEYILLAGNEKNTLFAEPFEYLKERGITSDMIRKYRIGFCLSGKYANRIIFPSYDDEGTLTYFVSRTINKKEKKYKYLNPDADKTQIIFNEYLIDWNEPVYLVEGVFDHVVIGNSIPLLGKKLYEKLFAALYTRAKNKIIILLDDDANDDAVRLYNKLDSGKLRGRIILTKMPENYDVSLFNQVYGNTELYNWINNRSFKLND